jgi:hypothetical protein
MIKYLTMLLSIKSGNEEQHLPYKDFEMPHHFLADVDGSASKVFILRWCSILALLINLTIK